MYYSISLEKNNSFNCYILFISFRFQKDSNLKSFHFQKLIKTIHKFLKKKKKREKKK